ncbi:MAG: carboxylesterase family protein [Bacteroidales bacterium]|nr:carboxylesterase family protein [Bacteroidales bacterium]
MKRFYMLAALSAVIIFGCSPKNPVLTVEGGQVQGVKTGEVYSYKGIPFAAAPVGDLRWKEPQPVTPWEGVKVADHFSAAAPQTPHDAANPYTSEFFFDGDPEFSEDCLYLNVWTKAPGKTSKKLPVAMWIHGGGYTAGWGFEPEMEGTEWAKKDVVLVTINYRLGVFGFLNHPFLAAESGHNSSGNYGILDQIAALKWVYNNISQFGGDPDNITIFGQSAGAGSVKTLVNSPLTGNLIKKAIIQSGGGASQNPAPANPNLSDPGEIAKTVFDWAGYDTLEKMRAASTEEVFNLAARYAAETGQNVRLSSSPSADGYLMTESFDSAANGGRIKDIPYMIGYTMNDMRAMDESIGYFCELREKAGKPAYAYEFARPLPDDAAGSHKMKGAFHSSELWYTFKSLANSDRPFTQDDYLLAERILGCWTSFVKTGKPGNGWEPYTSANPKFMVFKLDASGEDDSVMGDPITSLD